MFNFQFLNYMYFDVKTFLIILFILFKFLFILFI